jgi:histidyl-tRNA synthetase
VPEERLLDFLAVIDKWERASREESAKRLSEFGLTPDDIDQFLANPGAEADQLKSLAADLKARGLDGYIELDLTIVRGLAYYTGFVFEVFDRAKTERALAGGGRYDRLIELMSDGRLSLPALGFGMGDVVLANLIQDIPEAKSKRDQWIAKQHAADVFVIIAEETRRPEALGLLQTIREAGYRTDHALAPAKVGKQFQQAEQREATLAVIIGQEWPTVKLKHLARREETSIDPSALLPAIAALLRPQTSQT